MIKADMSLVQEPLAITGLMLRRAGGENSPYAEVIVEVEVHGRWFVVCREYIEANFSHIVEPQGMRKRIREQGGMP